MKLATVNPELNIDIERILSKDVSQARPNAKVYLMFKVKIVLNKRNQSSHFCFQILNLRGGNGAIFGFGPGINSSQPYQHGIFQGTLPTVQSTAPQYTSLPQASLGSSLLSYKIIIKSFFLSKNQ